MSNTSYKLILSSSILALFFSACTNYKKIQQTVGNEIQQSNGCVNKQNKELENDCYDLISYKNSIALLRLGINAYYEASYDEAFKRYSLSKLRGNPYANTLLAQLYMKGKGVKQNTKKALELLEEVKDFDPMAAYELALYHMKKDEYDKAIDLLKFASKNNLKEAQGKLLEIYKEGRYIKVDDETIKALYLKYEDKKNDIKRKIYGF